MKLAILQIETERRHSPFHKQFHVYKREPPTNSRITPLLKQKSPVCTCCPPVPTSLVLSGGLYVFKSFQPQKLISYERIATCSIVCCWFLNYAVKLTFLKTLGGKRCLMHSIHRLNAYNTPMYLNTLKELTWIIKHWGDVYVGGWRFTCEFRTWTVQ